LGSIPGIGRLFRSNTDSVSDHNLVVFITAKTVRPDGAATGEIFDPRITRQMELEQADLPGFRDGSDPYFHPAPPKDAKK
jgi:type IV pilus assembly protein PilQ